MSADLNYRKKPVVIQAFRWTIDEVPDWWTARADITIDVVSGDAFIPTLEGEMRASVGDYIIRGVKGEIYPCKPDIFAVTYEPENTRTRPAIDAGEIEKIITGMIVDAIWLRNPQTKEGRGMDDKQLALELQKRKQCPHSVLIDGNLYWLHIKDHQRCHHCRRNEKKEPFADRRRAGGLSARFGVPKVAWPSPAVCGTDGFSPTTSSCSGCLKADAYNHGLADAIAAYERARKGEG